MASESKPSPPIPVEFFDGLCYFLPGLGRIAEKDCGLTLTEWSVLWFLRSQGTASNGGYSMLRHVLTRRLTERGFTPGAVTKVVESLQKKRLVQRATLTPEEREAVFKSAMGPKLTVTLLPEGVQRLDLFASELAKRLDVWRKKQPPLVRVSFTALRKKAATFAEWLTKGRSPS